MSIATIWGDIAPSVLPTMLNVGGIIVTGVLTAVLTVAKSYLHTKLRNDAVDRAFAVVAATINTVVANLMQTTVKQLKAVSPTGTLTNDQKRNVLSRAVKDVFEALPRPVANILENSTPDALVYLKRNIEQSVLQCKSNLPIEVKKVILESNFQDVVEKVIPEGDFSGTVEKVIPPSQLFFINDESK